jgi:hypothetical protein
MIEQTIIELTRRVLHTERERDVKAAAGLAAAEAGRLNDAERALWEAEKLDTQIQALRSELSGHVAQYRRDRARARYLESRGAR